MKPTRELLDLYPNAKVDCVPDWAGRGFVAWEVSADYVAAWDGDTWLFSSWMEWDHSIGRGDSLIDAMLEYCRKSGKDFDDVHSQRLYTRT
jgi:hypothetical protein